jgi:ferrochelatase
MAPQYSALSTGAYVKKVEEARAALHDETPINFVASWHRHPQLIQAILDNIQAGLQLFPADVRPRVPILFTAHSLPSRVLDMNDPYPLEVQGTVDALRERLGTLPTRFAYQSQGRSQEPWLGPSVEQAVDELAQEGYRELLVAPIGFLCDHIETLFDVDIELKESAARKGLRLERIPMLNDSAPLIDVLASVVDMHETLVAH